MTSMVSMRAKAAFAAVPVKKAAGYLARGVAGFGLVILSQGHAAEERRDDAAAAMKKRGLAHIWGNASSAELRVHYWKTDFSKGECGHVSISAVADGKEVAHIGHWPKDLLGETPASIFFPASAKPAMTLSEDVQREDGEGPARSISIPVSREKAQQAAEKMIDFHHGDLCYSIVPRVSRLFHSVVAKLPGGPAEERTIENCTSIVQKVAQGAGLLEGQEEILAPTDLFEALQSLAKGE